jgi:hypothetical protein
MSGNGSLNGARNITPKRLRKPKSMSEKKSTMKIKKELKNATFEYDEEKKSFTIYGEHPALRDVSNTVELNKVYAFAFMRFVVRISQRNWLRPKKKLDKSSGSVVSLDEIEDIPADESQMLIFEEAEDEQNMGI